MFSYLSKLNNSSKPDRYQWHPKLSKEYALPLDSLEKPVFNILANDPLVASAGNIYTPNSALYIYLNLVRYMPMISNA